MPNYLKDCGIEFQTPITGNVVDEDQLCFWPDSYFFHQTLV